MHKTRLRYDVRVEANVIMRLNQFVFLLASTVILGGLMGIITIATGLWLHLPWFVAFVSGAFLATTSLMGFWAYLTLNFIARSTLPRRVWRWMQVIITALVLYDMLWYRYHIDAVRHPANHPPYATFLIQGLWPFVVALIAAGFKRRLSGKGSFVPTVFYLYVFTVVDWLLVIRSQTGPIVNQTGIVMMACNVYMILIFGKLLSPDAGSFGLKRQEMGPDAPASGNTDHSPREKRKEAKRDGATQS
ncbi:KinB-signaling pathway activation protein [Alicyclobacillus tolerans]|uniref:KinB-signaling pathway activation protein n=1 Tax=Alicyclobacillus tolerans TaxID=90970 RepID=UPI001F40AA99|nr:KinB-signaling pathway activation protein [Alicyclobacillus tolerans]MCF8565972.1 KinB-signaling pathway activation protein [Alicyclobacillus tolerans]